MKLFFENAFAVISRLLKTVVGSCSVYLKNICGFAKKLVRRGINYFICSDIKVKISAVAVCLFLAATGTITACGLTLIYGVSYEGVTLGYVADKAMIDRAMETAINTLDMDNPSDYIGEINFFVAVGTSHKLSDTKEIAERIIKNTDEIKECGRLMVNGEVFLYAQNEEIINNALNARLNSFTTGSQGETLEFVDETEAASGYCDKKIITPDDDVDAAIAGLSVRSVVTTTYEESTAYKTVTEKSSARTVGYSKVSTAGKNGVNRVTARVTYINGVEQSRQVVSTETVAEPVNEVVVVGTAPVSSGKGTRSISSKGFIWPVAKADGEYISSYFGDGRNHKGWDIAAPAGTAIYATLDGTVISSGWSCTGYGYCIEIDHGNGFTTLYAHCSTLRVSKGDKVSKGQVIANIGMTGNASGNHLHIETRLNGKAQNPDIYF